MRNSDPARIFSRVEKSGNGCWLYKAGINSRGYGVISIKNKSVQTHRVAYELKHGPIPKGMCVLHRCDVRRCINPDHLFLGTLGENNTDRKSKGRNDDRRGERNPLAKITPEIVAEVRDLYATSGLSQAAVGKRFGLSQQHVSQIVRGEAWPHLLMEGSSKDAAPEAR